MQQGNKGCAVFKHGHCGWNNKSKTYRAWRSMIGRCYNPNNNRYRLYGGRGITVCERWRHSFENFLTDMGEPPTDKHSLDRKETNGIYEKSNCQWSDIYTQANNKRRNVYVEIGGIKMSVSQAERHLGFNPGKLKQRLYKGYTLQEAINLPKHGKKLKQYKKQSFPIINKA